MKHLKREVIKFIAAFFCKVKKKNEKGNALEKTPALKKLSTQEEKLKKMA